MESHMPSTSAVLGKDPSGSEAVPEHPLHDGSGVGWVNRSQWFHTTACERHSPGGLRAEFDEAREQFASHQRHINGKHQQVGRGRPQESSENSSKWSAILDAVQQYWTGMLGVIDIGSTRYEKFGRC
jgi:hypothetical protein